MIHCTCMFQFVMAAIIVIFLFEAAVGFSAFLRGPSNVAVVAGTNMTMTCEPPLGTNMVYWYHTPVRSKDITPALLPINDGSKIFKNFTEFSVEGRIPGELLSLNVTQLKHAGFYQCTAAGRIATAQLVVLASEPRCSFSVHGIEEEEIRVDLLCSVLYNGHWAPTVEWSQTFNEWSNVRVIPIEEYSMEDFENELISNLSLMINSSTRGFRYSSKTYFRNISSNVSSTIASNAPKYESVWTSPYIEMLHCPKNVTVFPLKHVFHPDDVLTCSADSTLSLEFKWTEIETGNIFKGPNFVVMASMVRSEPYSFLCTAINKLTGANRTSSLLKFTVKEHDVVVNTENEYGENDAEDRRQNSISIYSVSAISFAIPVAIAGCLFAFRYMLKRRRLRDLQKKQESPEAVTRPTSTSENTSTGVCGAVTVHTLVELQRTGLNRELPDEYDEIETESEGTPSSCYNFGKVSGQSNLPQDDKDLGSNERISNSSAGSKQTLKSTRYDDLLERDPIKPSVYTRIMQSHKEQDTQTSNSPSSSQDNIQSQTIYVNVRNASSSSRMQP